MLLSRAHYPVTALGHGVRAGIWTQGCRIHCDGCVARDTWEPTPNAEVPVSELLDWLAGLPDFDGVTISGGEPLDQPDELLALLQGIRDQHGPGIDILCFTGRRRGAVESAHGPVLDLVDAIIVGPFKASLPTRHPLMGSANQEVITPTLLGRTRYGDLAPTPRRPLQTTVEGNMLNFVGIPNPGDLEAIEHRLRTAGVELVAPSWRPETP